MQELGKIHQIIFSIFGYEATFNLEVMVMTWIVILLLLLFGWACSFRRSMVPNRFQVVGELIVSKLYELTEDAMGKPVTPHYGDEWIALYWETIGLVKKVFQTKNDIYMLVSSGSARPPLLR